MIFSYLTTYLVKKFGKLIAITSLISIGIIISAIIVAHEDGCVVEADGLNASKVCWINENFSRFSSRISSNYFGN